MNNQIPRPLFAPASNQGQNSDDFDLSEIFAEYFFNDYEDPLNAYTGGMANYGISSSGTYNPLSSIMGSASSTATRPNDRSAGAGVKNNNTINNSNSRVPLPTGGIRTAFHTGVVAPVPAPKKLKVGESNALQMMNQQQQQQLQIGASQSQQNSMMYGVQQQQQQALLPQLQLPAAQQQQQIQQRPQQQQQQQQPPTTTTQIANVALSGGIQLPVGVGIRLGGIGGVAPASAAQSRFGQFGVGASGSGSVFPAGAPYGQSMMWNNGIDPAEEGMSEEAITERRQRNREHAKRSRVRKKFMLESMQEEVRALQRENNRLRMLVQEEIPEHAMQILADCCTHNILFGDTGDGSNIPSSEAGGDNTGSLERSDFSLMQSLAAGQRCFVLSDPKLPDNPIVFATPDFYKLTGYTSQEVLGRNCRFLQGPGTDKRAVDVIRKAVSTGSDATVCLINYKADGTPFWNQFFIAALRDSDNNIVNFVGVQTEVEPDSSLVSSLEDKVNKALPLQNKE